MSPLNQIHPTAIVGPLVQLGQRNVIGPGVIIQGSTRLGDDNWIGPYSCIGLPPDILGIPSTPGAAWWDFDAESEFGVDLGCRNVLKESVTIHSGSHRHTRVGDNCYLMPRSHLGHDCWLGDNVLVSPSGQLAGHVAVGSRSVIGMGALVHQFSAIGPVSMVGMGCHVRGQVESCRTVVGEPHRVTGINRVGLIRFLGDEDAQIAIMQLKIRNEQALPENLKNALEEWRRQIVNP